MTSRDNLIWIDLEMTGLSPEQDVIIEIATVVTDVQLQVLAEGPVEPVSLLRPKQTPARQQRPDRAGAAQHV